MEVAPGFRLSDGGARKKRGGMAEIKVKVDLEYTGRRVHSQWHMDSMATLDLGDKSLLHETMCFCLLL